MTRKHRTGTLYRRGNVWWLKYMLEGKMFYENLETDDEDDAKKKQTDFMRPFIAASTADALAVVAKRLDHARTEHEKIEDEKNPPLKLADAWEAYVESEIRPHRAGERTLTDYEGTLTAFNKWMQDRNPDSIYMRDVTPEDAQAYVRHMTKKRLSGNRINKALAFLKTLFRVLAKQGRMTENPFADIARREQLSNTKRPLTIEELKSIIESASGEMRTLFMIGTFTGLRMADAVTLRWDETDLARGIIRRIPRKTARSGKAVIIGIPAILSEHLTTLPRRGPFITPKLAAQYERDQSALCKQIQAHFEKCGVQTVKPDTGFVRVKNSQGNMEWKHTGKRAVVLAGFHSLRHTFVSLHAQAGTPQAVLQKLAGHGNPMMTEHYTHIDEGTAKAAAAALPAIITDTKPVKALPVSRTIEAEKVRKLAKRLTAKNADKIKKELLALAG